MPHVHFNEEQKQRANSVDLVDFLQRQGEQLTRAGREWRWKRHDSVTVCGSQWFRHSRKEGGRAIDFVQQFFNLSFPETVQLLLGGEAGVEWNQTTKSAQPFRKAFTLRFLAFVGTVTTDISTFLAMVIFKHGSFLSTFVTNGCTKFIKVFCILCIHGHFYLPWSLCSHGLLIKSCLQFPH